MPSEEHTAHVPQKLAYAKLMEETGIALEVIDGGAGIVWVTGKNGQIWGVTSSTGRPHEIRLAEFEEFLDECDLIVMDARELPAFRELVE